MGQLFKTAVRPLQGATEVPVGKFLGHLSDHGLDVKEVPERDLLDEAIVAFDAKVLAIGPEKVSLLLGRKEQDLIVADCAGAPSKVDARTHLAERPGQRYYVITRKTGGMGEGEKFGWSWFLRAFFSRKKVIRDVVVASLVIHLIGLAFPLATQAIVDKVITNQALSTLVALGIGIGLFAIFNGLMSWVRQKLLLRLANVVDGELSTRVMLHMFRLPLKYFEARSTGLLVTRAKAVERVREFASNTFLLLALDLPFMVIFLGLMVAYSLALTGVVLLFVTVMLGLSFACGPAMRAKANGQFEAGARVQSFMTEKVAAHETVKSLQLEDETVAHYSELNRKELDASLQLGELGNGYGTTMSLLEQLMNATVLCLGAYLAMTGSTLTIGMLVAFQMFAQRVAQPLQRLAGAWQQLQQVRTAVAQLGELMNAPTERYSAAPTSAGRTKGQLTVKGLSYRHAPDRPLLYNGLDFTLEHGQVALVTGPSGCGKSTLAKVLLGLYPGYEGQVLLDGRDLRSMPVNERRAHFGIVPQETVLFSGTVLENLLAGNTASMEQVVQACQMAGIHDVIVNLQDGYQAVIGERGAGLSGGQRQRIGVARALLKRPSVLVFDEATSALDAEAAEHLGETVAGLRGRVTVIFIAHKVPLSLKQELDIQLGGK